MLEQKTDDFEFVGELPPPPSPSPLPPLGFSRGSGASVPPLPKLTRTFSTRGRPSFKSPQELRDEQTPKKAKVDEVTVTGPAGSPYVQTLANAFGVTPPLPYPLTVPEIVATTVKTNQIRALDGHLMFDFTEGDFISAASNMLYNVTTLFTNNISFSNNSGLFSYGVLVGSYSSAAGPFTGLNGTYKMVFAGQQISLYITGATGTAITPIPPSPNVQVLTLTPDVSAYFPAVIQSSPCPLVTTLSGQGWGGASVVVNVPQVLINDSGDVTNWGWTAAGEGQGWANFTMTWCNGSLP